MRVKIIPKRQRARNRIQEHGEIMEWVKFDSIGSILVKSIGYTYKGEKWLGWFLESEAGYEFLLDSGENPK